MTGRTVWPVYLLVVAAVTIALVWLTRDVIALQHQEVLVERTAHVDAQMRAALWRLDSTFGPLVATASDDAVAVGALGPVAERARLRYPSATWREHPEWGARAVAAVSGPEWNPPQGPSEAIDLTRPWTPPIGTRSDFPARQQALSQTNSLALDTNLHSGVIPVRAGPMRTMWVDRDRLALIRRARRATGETLEILVVVTTGLTERIRALVGDLVPGVQVTPWSDPGDATYPLASLPVALQPPRMSREDADTPLQRTLTATWSAVAVALGAVGVLLGIVLAAQRRRSDFVSAVTHELRTPITSLQLYADLLTGHGQPDAATRGEYLETIRAESQRLGHLVENVLAYARLQHTAPGGGTRVLTVGELLIPILATLQRRARTSRRILTTPDLTPEGPDAATVARRVRTDPAWVEQILVNVVDNACKYAVNSPDERLVLTIGIEGRRLMMRVRDHGPGVDEDVRPRLFRPFHRSGRDTARRAPGIGLGLSLSRTLARRLGGDLTFHPENPGAAFVLVLPLQDADEDPRA